MSRYTGKAWERPGHTNLLIFRRTYPPDRPCSRRRCFADICRDLCIMPSDPLWPELRDLIIHYDGRLARLVKDIFDRTLGPLPSARDFRALAAPAPPSPEPSGTGPP